MSNLQFINREKVKKYITTDTVLKYILIVAPFGYGKSWLLTEVAELLKKEYEYIPIDLEEKIPLDEIKGLEELLSTFRAKGLRDLIRYSGTENKIRLLLEGNDQKEVEYCMEELQIFIKSKLC